MGNCYGLLIRLIVNFRQNLEFYPKIGQPVTPIDLDSLPCFCLVLTLCSLKSKKCSVILNFLKQNKKPCSTSYIFSFQDYFMLLVGIFYNLFQSLKIFHAIPHPANAACLINPLCTTTSITGQIVLLGGNKTALWVTAKCSNNRLAHFSIHLIFELLRYWACNVKTCLQSCSVKFHNIEKHLKICFTAWCF